jgi:hypothetical protein
MSKIKEKLLNRTAHLGVVGLGYVGLPLAVEKAKAVTVSSDSMFKNRRSIWSMPAIITLAT